MMELKIGYRSVMLLNIILNALDKTLSSVAEKGLVDQIQSRILAPQPAGRA